MIEPLNTPGRWVADPETEEMMTEFDPVHYRDPNAKPPKARKRYSVGRLMLTVVFTLLFLSCLGQSVGRIAKNMRTMPPMEQVRLEQVDRALERYQEELRNAYTLTASTEEFAVRTREVLDYALQQIELLATGETINDHVARSFVEYNQIHRGQLERYLRLSTLADQSGAYDPARARSIVELQSYLTTLRELAELASERVELSKSYSSFVREKLTDAGFSKMEIDRMSAAVRTGLYQGNGLRTQELDVRIFSLLADSADMLRSRWGTWSYDSDGLVFDRDEDVVVYNQLMAEIDAAVAEQDRLIRGN